MYSNTCVGLKAPTHQADIGRLALLGENRKTRSGHYYIADSINDTPARTLRSSDAGLLTVIL